MKEKLRLIVLPWILISFSVMLVCWIGYWALILEAGYDGLTEMLTHYWIPLAIAGLTAWLALRRRLKLLHLASGGTRDYSTFYYFMATATLAVPLIIGIHLLDTATGELVTLDKNTEIHQHPRSRFFQLNGYAINRNDVGFYSVADRRGKYGRRLRYTLYFTLPVQESLEEYGRDPVLFLGVKYDKEISNRLDDAEKKRN